MWEQQTLLLGDLHVSPSASPENEKDSPEHPDSCSSTFERYVNSVRLGLSGRTCRERSQASGGGAYRQLLSEMDALGYGLAWRVLDAEFFDVPQRRERLFLVGHLGDQRAAEVLFDEQGLSWDFTSGREKRKALAQAARGGVGDADQGVGGNLTSGQNQQAVLTVQTANTNSNGSPVKDGQVADTLDTNNSMAVAFNTNTGVSGHAGSLAISEDTSPTLKTDHAPAVLPFAQNQRNEIRETPVSGALATRQGKNQTYVCRMDMAVNSAADEDCAGTLTAHAFKANPYIYPSEGTAVNPEPPVTLQVRCGKPEGAGKGALFRRT